MIDPAEGLVLYPKSKGESLKGWKQGHALVRFAKLNVMLTAVDCCAPGGR